MADVDDNRVAVVLLTLDTYGDMRAAMLSVNESETHSDKNLGELLYSISTFPF